MRVCVVYDCLFPYTVGGGERWYRGLAERLAADGHEVTYLTLRQWERGAEPDAGAGVGVATAGPRMALYTATGRRRILPPLVFGLGVLWHLLRRGRSYDVVHTSAFPYFSLLAAALVRPLGRFELIVDWFEVWSRSYWRDYLGPIGGRCGELVQRACALVRQQAFCFSELHAARLRGLGLRGDVTVLRGLYDERADREPFEPGAARKAGPATPLAAGPVVLFAGRLIPEKQVTLAVEAIAIARERIDGLRGSFFGDGPERASLDRAIAAHRLQDIVSAPGFADAATLDAHMRSALCLLLPSRREGYGLVVVEASARGTPSVVVAGEDNAATELVVEGINGAVAPVPDPEAIADAIIRVHAAGATLHESTANWYARNAELLSLEHSLRIVLDSYEAPMRHSRRIAQRTTRL
jgi:glycosyltransferase involved in cell wall biosynthesis